MTFQGACRRPDNNRKHPSAIAIAWSGASKPDELVLGLMVLGVDSQCDAEFILEGPGRIVARDLIAQSITLQPYVIDEKLLHSNARTTLYSAAWYWAYLVPYLRGWVLPIRFMSLRRVFDLTSRTHWLRDMHTEYSSVLPERS